jgi:hypothetical protein
VVILKHGFGQQISKVKFEPFDGPDKIFDEQNGLQNLDVSTTDR